MFIATLATKHLLDSSHQSHAAEASGLLVGEQQQQHVNYGAEQADRRGESIIGGPLEGDAVDIHVQGFRSGRNHVVLQVINLVKVCLLYTSDAADE